MISRRRVVTLVVVVLTVLILYHTIFSSSEHGLTAGSGVSTLSRSYPPTYQRQRGQQNVITDMASRSLRSRIEYYFPYDNESKFPAYIWQTWKTAPSSGDFSQELRESEASWTEKHPGFVHEVIVDDAAEHLIRYLFASIPEIAEAYTAMPLPVLKADFFRYLILLARGGIYSDIDTQALKPAADWLPSEIDHSTVGLVVGIEADPDRDDWQDWYARRIQFCQWTIQAKPGHPALRDLVATITETTLEMKAKNQLVKGRQPTSTSVMEFTGPGVWTDAIFNHFNSQTLADFEGREQVRNVTVGDFFGLSAHKKVGDVLVLPITSFSPGVGQMGAGDTTDPMAFVYHAFHGSWKPEEERKSSG